MQTKDYRSAAKELSEFLAFRGRGRNIQYGNTRKDVSKVLNKTPSAIVYEVKYDDVGAASEYMTVDDLIDYKVPHKRYYVIGNREYDADLYDREQEKLLNKENFKKSWI